LLKFGIDVDHVTADTLQTLKVKGYTGQEVKDTACRNVSVVKKVISQKP